MAFVDWTLVALGLMSIVFGASSAVHPLSLGAIYSNQAPPVLVRRTDDPPRYWTLIQVRLIQILAILILVVVLGSRLKH